MQDSASFWTEIQKLEERLSKSPDSFCFAELSAVYLKAGLIDDALHVAREGVAKHPDYLAGQRALSLACHAKELYGEALIALRRIVSAFPEDILSQKLLGRLLVESGEQDSAMQVYRVALEFAPEDVECCLQLEALEHSAGVAASVSLSSDNDQESEDDEEIIEDLEILDEFEVLDEDLSESEQLYSEAPSELATGDGRQHDPLSTSTLAELYVSQGYSDKALDIYRAILAVNPENDTVSKRITELEATVPSATESVPEEDFTIGWESEGHPVSDVLPNSFPEIETSQFTGSAGNTVCNVVAESSAIVCSAPEVPLKGRADNARATLDGWLENIRRIKSCR